MKQRMILMTLFYNPAVVNPDDISEGVGQIAEDTLFSSIEECVEQGGIVRVSHIEAELVRLTRSQNGVPPAHEWVGLTFVPVQPVASEAIIMEEAVDAQ